MPRSTNRWDEARLQGRLWTPDTLGGQLSTWFDAEGPLDCASSNAVSTWRDRSPNANDAIQSTLGSRPAFDQNAVQHHAGVKFTVGSSFMTLGSAISGANDVTLYAALNFTATSGYRTVIAGSSASGAPLLGFDNVNKMQINKDNVAVLAITPTAVAAGFHVCSARSGYTKSPAAHVIAVDGTVTTATVAGSFSNSINQVAKPSNTTTYDSYIFELLMVAGYHSNQMMRAVEGYLAWRWRDSANPLIASHPFKNRPPLIGD